MIKKFTDEQFASASSKDLLPLQCTKCGSTFFRRKSYIANCLNPNCHNTGQFCSPSCGRFYNSPPPILTHCCWCGKNVRRTSHDKNKNSRYFCCRSCSAKYSNTHKETGTRRSKLEAWIEKQFGQTYPDLIIEYNKIEAIGAELDIFIPKLNLAFELNGIFHYEPIYGQNKLASIKCNDQRKFQACAEKGIELCIIDVSRMKYFKEDNARPYWNIIKNIVDSKLASLPELASGFSG